MGLSGWRLCSVALAALLAGYCLATAAGVFIGSLLPVPRGEAVLIGMLCSFVVYAGAVIWAFAVRRPAQVWLGLMIPACTLAAAGAVLAGSPL